MSFEEKLREALTHQDKLSRLVQTIMSGGARLEYIYNDSPQLETNLSGILRQCRLPSSVLFLFLDQWRQNIIQEYNYLATKGPSAAVLFGGRLLFILNNFIVDLHKKSTRGAELSSLEQPAVVEITPELSLAQRLKLSESFISQSTCEILKSRYPKLKQIGFYFDELLDLGRMVHGGLAITHLAKEGEKLVGLGFSTQSLLDIAKFNYSVLAYLVNKTENLLKHYQNISQISKIATLPNAISTFERNLNSNKALTKNHSFFSSVQTVQALLELEGVSDRVSRKITVETVIELTELKKSLPVAVDWYINPLRDNYIWIAPSHYNFARFKKILGVMDNIHKRSHLLGKFEYDDKSLTISLPKNLWPAFYPNNGHPQYTLKEHDFTLCTQTTQNYIRYIPDRAILVCYTRLNALINANHLKYLWEHCRPTKPSTDVIKVNQHWIEIDEWHRLEKILFPQPQIIINFWTQNINPENHYHQQFIVPRTLDTTNDAEPCSTSYTLSK